MNFTCNHITVFHLRLKIQFYNRATVLISETSIFRNKPGVLSSQFLQPTQYICICISLLILSLADLLYLPLTIGQWKLKGHYIFLHSTGEFKPSADAIGQCGYRTSRWLKVMSWCVSYSSCSAVSCSGLFYGGCLGLCPHTATAVTSISATGDWPQISGAKNRNVASFHWAVT